MNIFQNIHINTYMNIHIASDWITRASLTIPIVFAELRDGCWCVSLWKNVPDNQWNAPGMDTVVWRKPETKLEGSGWGLKVWEPLHVLRRASTHVGWTWLVGSARATTAAALHFRGRCRGGAPLATRAANLVDTFCFVWHKCIEIEASHCWKHRLISRKGGWWAA